MPAPNVESLRLINAKLHTRLTAWQSKPGESATLTPTIFTDMLEELRQAADLLKGISHPAAPNPLALDPRLEEEVAEYHRNVQQLGKVLPEIQARLLMEKARLESARAHVSAAAAWADGQKKTL